ncbi:uncharacterized protein KGF55_005530 [Candida pseudojiufengensis]|uniref:uncharacterized protein n=1 Tax=Candida pseudojiufengensis TaxID=497109 RepID=UPI002224D79E|nr:uncharacterized protein KGF55_005530 [Candida pseudojiufengensis]KAI5959187.1 hypothetical protein KGF55_005530 [Candida pseudojiufengensis]
MIATNFQETSIVETEPSFNLINSEAIEKIRSVSIPKEFNRLTAKGYIKELLRCFNINSNNYITFKKQNFQFEKELDQILNFYLNQVTNYFMNYFETADYHLNDLILFNKNRDFMFFKNDLIQSIEYINSVLSNYSGFELDLIKNHLFNTGNNIKKFIIINQEISNLYNEYKSNILQPLEYNSTNFDSDDNEIDQLKRLRSYECKKNLSILYEFIYNDYLDFEERLNKGEFRKLNVYQLYKALGLDVTIYKKLTTE